MSDPGTRRRVISRETRLLILTITISAVVLLLLARLRFPERPAAVDTSEQPLERLAAQASFEELATRVARLEATIAPNLLVLRTDSPTDVAPRRLQDVLAHLESSGAAVRHVPALRISATTALAAIPQGARITGIVGIVDPSGTAAILGLDPVRSLARVRVPEGQARALSHIGLANLATPSYVVAVEGTRAGVTLRPVFLGRSDRFASPRWTRPLLPLGGIFVTAGALIFSLNGEFVGCAVVEEGMLAIAGASDVFDVVTGAGTSVPAVDAGIAVQPLTTSLAQATGAPRGVVVADVAESSAAAGVLQPGDVITAMDGQPFSDPGALLLALGMRLGAGSTPLTLMRSGKELAVTVEPAIPDRRRGAIEDLRLQAVRGVGTRLAFVSRGSPFERAGITPDDIIVRMGDVSAPSPSDFRRIVAKTPPGQPLLLVVRRGDRQRVVAVLANETDDVAGR
jgi:hypothetical protein